MAPFAEVRHRRSVHGGGNNSDNPHPTPWATMSYNHAQRARLSELHGSKRNPIYAKCLQCSGRRRVPRRIAQWEEAHSDDDGGELVADEPHAHHPSSPQLDQSFLLFRSSSPRPRVEPHRASLILPVRPVPAQHAGSYMCTAAVQPPLLAAQLLRDNACPFFFRICVPVRGR
jgi:hypothetical protein